MGSYLEYFPSLGFLFFLINLKLLNSLTPIYGLTF